MAFVGKRRSKVLAGMCLCVAAFSAMQCLFGGPLSQLAQVPGGDEQAAQYQKAAQIYAMVHQHHKATVAKVVAILALKMVIIQFLTVRTRLMTQNMARTFNEGKPWSEDENMPGWFVQTLKIMLVCYGPAPSTAMLDRQRVFFHFFHLSAEYLEVSERTNVARSHEHVAAPRRG